MEIGPLYLINASFKEKFHIILIFFNFYIEQTFPLHSPSCKYQNSQMTFCFFPDACSPLRMLASIASMSFTTKPKSLSQKLNTNCERFKTTEKAKLSNHPRGKVNEQVVRTLQVAEPAGWRRRPGCWTAGWTRRPSCPSRRGTSRCSSSAGSRSRWSWHRCTAWTCQSCSWTLRTDAQRTTVRNPG